MLRHSLQGLVVAAVAALTLGPAPAVAVTPIDHCATLDRAGETYVLTGNIGHEEVVCLAVSADRITIDLAGFTISGRVNRGPSEGIKAVADVTGTVVKNGTIREHRGEGINLAASSRNTIRGVTVRQNVVNGISVGPNSLVKDCTVQLNGLNGIVAGDGVQVQGCLIGGIDSSGNSLGSAGIGLQGGQRMLVTRNTVISNGTGIVVGPSSTVTHNTVTGNSSGGIVAGAQGLVTSNTVNDNVQDGIAIGQRSTVSFNTANGNSRDGIQALCPGTITHNVASGNGGLDIDSLGPGCVILNNTTSDGDNCSASDSALAAAC